MKYFYSTFVAYILAAATKYRLVLKKLNEIKNMFFAYLTVIFNHSYLLQSLRSDYKGHCKD